MTKSKLDPTKVRQIQEWLIQGHIISDIISNVTRKWGIKESDALEYISSALHEFTLLAGQGYKETKALHIQMLMNLYKKAIEDKEYKIAQSVLQDLAKIQDLS